MSYDRRMCHCVINTARMCHCVMCDMIGGCVIVAL